MHPSLGRQSTEKGITHTYAQYNYPYKGGEVDNNGDAGEVLEEDSGGSERDLAVGAGVGRPVGIGDMTEKG